MALYTRARTPGWSQVTTTTTTTADGQARRDDHHRDEDGGGGVGDGDDDMFAPNALAADRDRQAQQSRGYVLGLILLIMFLSSQDFSPPTRRRVEAAREMREGVNKHREDIKEKVSRGEMWHERESSRESCVPLLPPSPTPPPAPVPPRERAKRMWTFLRVQYDVCWGVGRGVGNRRKTLPTFAPPS